MTHAAPSNAAATSAVTNGRPNRYHLHGGGLTISYFPDGHGPITPSGPLKLTYQDTHGALSFHGDEVRTASVEDLGTVVSVTVQRTVDVGYTSFSVVIPPVNLAPQIGSSDTITTFGVTTLHKTPLVPIGHAQRDTYGVTRLIGTAAVGILPL